MADAKCVVDRLGLEGGVACTPPRLPKPRLDTQALVENQRIVDRFGLESLTTPPRRPANRFGSPYPFGPSPAPMSTGGSTQTTKSGTSLMSMLACQVQGLTLSPSGGNNGGGAGWEPSLFGKPDAGINMMPVSPTPAAAGNMASSSHQIYQTPPSKLDRRALAFDAESDREQPVAKRRRRRGGSMEATPGGSPPNMDGLDDLVTGIVPNAPFLGPVPNHARFRRMSPLNLDGSDHETEKDNKTSKKFYWERPKNLRSLPNGGP